MNLPDRRQARKRAFRNAGLAVAVGAAGALLLGGLYGVWFGVASFIAGLFAAAALLTRPGGVPVIVYHSVSPDASWLPWAPNTSVRPETFRRHLQTLKQMRRTVIPSSALVEARLEGKPLPPRPVVIHFDDGYLDNLLFAAPILREFGAPATIVVSLDFIEPGSAVRIAAASGPSEGWRGYMTDAELKSLDRDPLFDIEAHGTNHGRVPTGGPTGESVTAENWQRYAPLAWSQETGCKARWFEATEPPQPLRLGETIPGSDSVLTAKYPEESDADYAARLAETMERAHDGLAACLGRAPRLFVWPFDRNTEQTRAAAFDAGFAAVTGGRGENRADEPARILSRVHVQDRAFGGGPLWLEALALRARVNVASGFYLWHPVTVLAGRLRRRRLGPSGYRGAA